jgi:hypothetical protein
MSQSVVQIVLTVLCSCTSDVMLRCRQNGTHISALGKVGRIAEFRFHDLSSSSSPHHRLQQYRSAIHPTRCYETSDSLPPANRRIMSFVRSASQASRVGARVPATRAMPIAWPAQRAFSQSAARKNDAHAEETFEEFTARYDASAEGIRAMAGAGDTWDGGQPLSSARPTWSFVADLAVS